MLQKGSLVHDTSLLRIHPASQVSSQVPPPVRAEMVRLVQGILASCRGGTARVVMLTGAGPSVGTSYLATALAEVASSIGYAVGSLDLARPDFADEPPATARALRTLTDLVHQVMQDSLLDLVVMDAPPILGSAAALRLAGSVSGVILVVEADRSTEAQIRDALGAIEDCGGHCLGMVLNKRRRRWWSRR